ncbi:hypothetical protein [Candidatus Uabimicrobium sp. HlEnr_7]|uniref:hypothetical protein n=1 Tax=Candidatus Uabimicrobium helgolandensis TaxID=3095367 RepID=UPI003556545C
MRYLLPFLSLTILFGCSTKIVPIQMARIVQVARYTQNYKFDNDEQARNILMKVVGPKNWKIIEDHYVFGDVVQDMMEGRFVIEGRIIFTLSLDPQNHDRFYIDGFGKYHLHRKTTNETILAADFDIVSPEAFSLSDVKTKGYIELDVVKNYTRYFAPEQGNYFHASPLRFRLFIKQIKDDVYMVDYKRKHDVFTDGELLGELEFKPPYKHMVIDMRSLGYLKNDY